MERTNRGAEWRHGWPLVLAAMVGIGFGPGLFQNLSSLFTIPMIASFGWSRGEIATAAALGLLGGLVAPFVGRLADRFGIRPVIIACMALLALAYVGFAAMNGRLIEYQLLVVALACSVPGTSSVVYGKLITSCFVQHRGLALGFATSGLSLTTLTLPPLVAATISAAGWRGGFVLMAALTALLALPLVLLLIRRVPSTPTRPAPGDVAATHAVPGVTGKEARRDGRFWRLGLAVAAINLGAVGLVTSLVPFGTDRGLSNGEAALLLTAFGASQVAGRFAIGLLVDRYRPQVMAAAVALVSALGFAGLWAMDAAPFHLALALVFAAGLMNGAEHDLLPFFVARLFGLRAYGEVYGSILPLALAGNAAGIVAFGRLYDATGNYAAALALATAALVFAAVAFLSLGDRDLPAARAAAA